MAEFHLPQLNRNGNTLQLNKDVSKLNQSDHNVNNEKYISISFNPASKANSNKRLNDSLTKSEIDKNIGNLLNEGPLDPMQMLEKERPGTKQAPETMKKGMTKFYLNEDEEKEYLNYTVIKPEIINWEEL